MSAFLGRPSAGDSPFAIGDRAMRDTSSPTPPVQRNPHPRGYQPPHPPPGSINSQGIMATPSPFGAGSVSDEARRRYEERYAKKRAEEAAKAQEERSQNQGQQGQQGGQGGYASQQGQAGYGPGQAQGSGGYSQAPPHQQQQQPQQQQWGQPPPARHPPLPQQQSQPFAQQPQHPQQGYGQSPNPNMHRQSFDQQRGGYPQQAQHQGPPRPGSQQSHNSIPPPGQGGYGGPSGGYGTAGPGPGYGPGPSASPNLQQQQYHQAPSMHERQPSSQGHASQGAYRSPNPQGQYGSPHLQQQQQQHPARPVSLQPGGGHGGPQWSQNAPPPASQDRDRGQQSQQQQQGQGYVQQQHQGPDPGGMGGDDELRNMFDQFDSGRTGQLSSYDLQRLLAKDSLMEDPREDAVKMLMNIFDTDHSGSINYMEFEGLYRYIQDWHGIFIRFDRDRSGTIDRKELHQALLGFGFSLPSDMVRKLEKRFAPPPRAPTQTPHGQGQDQQRKKGISFDRFLMACVTVKHYTESFRRFDMAKEGKITVDYNQFMEMVLDAP